ncbi:MarR family transcriptional regulator [Nakamurella silvestris]|nr:MarR family transcriptional regulator [Nakamurella silvestris]
MKLFASLKARMQSLPDADQWAVPLLHRLAKGDSPRASDLADGFGSDPSTISRQVAALVKSGMVERQADPDDGRASILVITQAGRDRLAEHSLIRGRLMAPLVADWSDEDREAYLRLTQRFNEALTNSLEPMRESAATYFLGRPGRRENQ